MLAAELNHANCIRTWTQYFALHPSKKYRQTVRTGETALMVAASKGNVESVRALLQETRMKDSQGLTAIAHAIISRQAKTAQELFPVEGQTRIGGLTCLQFAIICDF